MEIARFGYKFMEGVEAGRTGLSQPREHSQSYWEGVLIGSQIWEMFMRSEIDHPLSYDPTSILPPEDAMLQFAAGRQLARKLFPKRGYHPPLEEGADGASRESFCREQDELPVCLFE